VPVLELPCVLTWRISETRGAVPVNGMVLPPPGMATQVGEVPHAHLARSLGADDRRRVTRRSRPVVRPQEADQRRLMRVEQQLFSRIPHCPIHFETSATYL